MERSRNIRLVSTDGQRVAYSPLTHTMAQPEHQRLAAPLRRAIARTRQWLLGEQAADGSWCAELEGDTILESEYILLLAFLGKHDTEIALEVRPLHSRQAKRRRRLVAVSRRQARHQHQRQSLLRAEAHRPRAVERRTCSGLARPFCAPAAPTR